MPPEHGVVSSNLTGRATLSGTKSEKKATAKHYTRMHRSGALQNRLVYQLDYVDPKRILELAAGSCH